MDMDMDTTVEYYNNKIKSRIFLTVSKVELTNIMSCYKNEIIKTKKKSRIFLTVSKV